MKISTILDHLDTGHMALPEFQRGFVWNGDQIRKLFNSLYLRRPVGGLLVWATESKTAIHRGHGELAAGVVKLLLDGQQRMTSVYGVVRGKPPKFFDGNPKTFMGLQFHLENQVFEFYQPIKMKDDPLWIDVTELLKKGTSGLGEYVAQLSAMPEHNSKMGDYIGRLSQLIGILDVELHVEEVTGADKTIDVVVDIFNQVNSGGTKLSKGDLALATICANWPEARSTMKAKLAEWAEAGYRFTLDWLLRSVNTIVTGEAKFQFLHNRNTDEVQQGLERATKHIERCLNLIAGRLGLDHDQVFFGKFAVPVMVRYLDQRRGILDEIERDKLLFWFVQAGMWGRFSSSTESVIDQDLAALEGDDGGMDKLLDQLRLWHGAPLIVEPGHFTGWSLGARFYPVLYLITRMAEARDWGDGTPLKANMLGKMSRLEVHHIFPKSQLYKRNFKRSEVNALSNFCFLTKDSNLVISNQLPENYFPKIEQAHPGALASQWIPQEPELWKMENYLEFLEARKDLLAAEVNRQLQTLLHGNTRWIEGLSRPVSVTETIIYGGFSSEEEQQEIEILNDWVEGLGLPRGEMAFELLDPETDHPTAILDLAWPTGVQQELSQPVAVLLNEPAELLAIASQVGYRCFTQVETFKRCVTTEVQTTSSA